ncbi:hypothetical protein ACFSKI_13445 [Pseudogracilibacillus auburnensis]|uniref:Uncharacterized protein n=1 Tax=Pseudogracilibacillus auburnensis TaxID=1494959 RepID=A0A2V3WBF9_9BACI|nr:hypothetical protein [Pseudogracilibacillus auburnensis]PXW90484.1 hypothetical protein DFR56_101396 [Pseudogracilibacillus auburnensis]
MGATLYLMFISIVLLSIFIIYKTIYYRNKITSMTGMMIAMTLGMSVGLTVGVILGILISDNFFIATVFGMLAGMFVGFLAGLPISLVATLDGLLSGLMGGMIGAMLGEMITAEYQDAIVKIMFFLFLGTLLILVKMINQEVNKAVNFYRSLYITVVLFGMLFVIFEQLGSIFIQ